MFYDEEKKLIALKPDTEGYKINTDHNHFHIKCMPLAKIIIGEFYPEWNKKEKMLVFGY